MDIARSIIQERWGDGVLAAIESGHFTVDSFDARIGNPEQFRKLRSECIAFEVDRNGLVGEIESEFDRIERTKREFWQTQCANGPMIRSNVAQWKSCLHELNECSRSNPAGGPPAVAPSDADFECLFRLISVIMKNELDVLTSRRDRLQQKFNRLRSERDNVQVVNDLINGVVIDLSLNCKQAKEGRRCA